MGDGLSAVAAGLASNAFKKKQITKILKSSDQSKVVKALQKQIDYLINELMQVKKVDY
ncbi:hypothetical protein OL548_23630 [Lysinibacillus sp. MHQ-1]|nr:hypothetical protein OL548_23630 [Lysinibacillus sp. MHQ-1]